MPANNQTEVKARSNLQNRVDPWGNLQKSTEKGAWHANRGILHDDQKQIITPWKPWQHNGWVTCLLKYKNNHIKELFTKGNYSELFILDEVTSFSAGHRPCARCRNKRYKEFKRAWVAANRDKVSSDDPPYKKIDEVLHRERTKESEKKTYDPALQSMPNGTMIDIKGTAYLVWRRRLYKWSFAGYEEDKAKHAPDTLVQVLTPESIVRMFEYGFVPQVHVSAFW